MSPRNRLAAIGILLACTAGFQNCGAFKSTSLSSLSSLSDPDPPVTPIEDPNPIPAPLDSQVTYKSRAGIVKRRADLIQFLFQSPVLPSTQSSVTSGITNPVPSLSNVARVDHYTATMPNGQTNESNLYIAASGNNNRVVILNPGHTNTCDWTAVLNPTDGVGSLMRSLLSAGFNVFAMNMPACGSSAGHDSLFTSYGETSIRYFVEPAFQAINYWAAHQMFIRYDMVGISGGGWTTTIVAALDPRIQLSIPVAGSMPGVQFLSGAGTEGNKGDSEQRDVSYYAIAGYLDHYVMGSYGTGRKQIQILNNADSCCFGNAEWTPGYQSFYGVNWADYLTRYGNELAQAQTQFTPMNYVLIMDSIATGHQISSYAQGVIMNALVH